jgi:hypothetical protein
MIGVLLVRKWCRALGNCRTDIRGSGGGGGGGGGGGSGGGGGGRGAAAAVVMVVIVLIGMFNVFLSITAIS